MEQQPKWTRITFIVGVIALVLGTLDPMEGSVPIAAASVTLTVASHYANDRYRKLFLVNSLLIVAGVIYLFAISSVGGFLGNTGRSWVWGLPIAPYPIGWLSTVILLIARGIQNRRNKKKAMLKIS